MTVEIKICGITREVDIDAALSAGATYLGFVLYPPSKRYVSVGRLRELIRHVNRRCRTVGVFVNVTADLAKQAMSESGLDIAQLHGDESPGLQWSGLDFPVWRAVWVDDTGWRPDLNPWPMAERILIDRRDAASFGGGGRTANWDVAARLARLKPAMLAGGLTPENVAAAITVVKPMGVDVSSGVETAPGIKDSTKIEAFVRAARS